MRIQRPILAIGVSIVVLICIGACWPCSAQQTQNRVLRLAELEIDPAQLETYKVALKEEIDTSIRIEPGVLMLYAVALKENPTHLRLFEIYADETAYRAHLETPHFKKYKSITQGMVQSLKLLEAEPISLGAKSNRECG